MGGFFKDNYMTLNEYITSNILSTQEKDTLAFRLYAFLGKVFSSSFAEELYKIFKEVEVTEKNRKDEASFTKMEKDLSKNIKKSKAGRL